MSKKKKAPAAGAESPTEEQPAPKRPKQMEIPGAERPSIPDLDDAMEAFDELKGRCKAMAEAKKAAQELMVALAKHHQDQIGVTPDGVLKYRSDHVVLVIEPKGEKVSTYPADDEGENAPADTSEGN